MFVTIATTLAIAMAPAVQGPSETAHCMLRIASSNDPIVSIGTINAPVAEVWQLFSTSTGIRKWMATSGEVEFRIGGKYKTSYQANSKLDGPDTIINDILAIDPYRMITIKNSKAPEKFPWKSAMEKCWTVMYFHDLDGKRTKLEVRMNGYDDSAESVEMKKNFTKWNQEEVDGLVKLYADKKGGKVSGQAKTR